MGSKPDCIEAAKELALRKDRSVLADVANLLRRSKSDHVREIAAWLLGELSPGTDFTIDALHATISDPKASESLVAQAVESLGNQVSDLRGGEVYERAADALLPLLCHPSVEILYNAVFALGAMRCRRARSELERIAGRDQRIYKGLESIGQAAEFSIRCIDYGPRGR